MMNCIACGIVKKAQEAVIIYQDDLICCFMDIDPINNGHVLIVPNRHVQDVDNLTDDELLRIMNISQKILKVLRETYNLDGYSMMQNGGKCDELNHYHMHIFPRYLNDGFSWNYPKGTMNDIKSEGKKIKELLNAEL